MRTDELSRRTVAVEWSELLRFLKIKFPYLKTSCVLCFQPKAVLWIGAVITGRKDFQTS